MAKPFSPLDIKFTVRRRRPELVAPAKPTPHEVKLLSDIDDQEALRFQVPLVHVYSQKPSMRGKDPAQIIKMALAQTLVFYYPFAGRLREGPGRKLMVDCNEEGVLFIEADADVSLHQFGDRLQPPPCFEELLYSVPGSEAIINCPLLLIQVTRLKCGGFILAIRLNHTMADGPGLVQFLKALSEFAKGASEPSIPPIWCRHILNARDPPRITCTHNEYAVDKFPNNDDDERRTEEDMVYHSFFFGPNQLKAIRQLFPHQHGPQNSTYEVLTAFIWRCRTIALQVESDKDVRLMCLNNVRGKTTLVPPGYYGNAFVYPAAVTTAGELCGNSFGYALEMVKKSKAMMTVEYIKSVADLMVIKGRPNLVASSRSWIVSDLTRAGLEDIDFGWGKAIFGGVAMAGAGDVLGVSFFVPYKNAKGEEGIAVPIYLPVKSMMIFISELEKSMLISKL